jgi:hypothetical protein
MSCAFVVVLSVCAPSAQAPRAGCLHQGESATRADRVRREEALQTTRLINTVMAQGQRFGARRFLTWPELANSGALAPLRSDGGPMGQLVRKIAWGTSEPLPGWTIHFVTVEDAYAFRLRDVRDPCGFSYSSDESGAIYEGNPLGQPRTIVPITQ